MPVLSAADVGVGLIDPEDIGTLSAHLLALCDVAPHNHAKYVLNEPEDVTGIDIVKAVESHVGVKVEKVEYADKETYFGALTGMGLPEKIITAMFTTVEDQWQGKCTIASHPASKEVLALAPPKRTVADVLKAMLAGFD